MYSILTGMIVRRLGRRGDAPNPHAIHSQGLRHPHSPAPPHHCHERSVFLVATLQDLDPVESVDDVGQHVRSHRLYALDVLEEEELSYELGILGCLHGS